MRKLLCGLFPLWLLTSCSFFEKDRYVGEYELDLSASSLGKHESVDSVLDLKLSIRNDQTFRYSKNVVFVYAQSGTWELRKFSGIDIPTTYNCYFKFKGMAREDILLSMDGECNQVYFQRPMSRTDYKDQVELLVFRRIN